MELDDVSLTGELDALADEVTDKVTSDAERIGDIILERLGAASGKTSTPSPAGGSEKK